jgi:subtilisin family serine protease
MVAAATTAALLVAPGASAKQQPSVRSTGPAVAGALSPDRVIVEWAPGASPAERRGARKDADVDFGRDLGNRRFQLVETEPGQTPRDAIRELRTDPSVVLAERDGYATELAIPNDPLFGQLWGLQNTGLGVDFFQGPLAGADIDASSAWERTVGTASTVVAVIDAGYRFEHPDLADRAWTNPIEAAGTSGVDDDENGVFDDIHGADFVGADLDAPTVDGDPTDDDLFTSPGGHGVHVAGTIGAEGNNGIGITGVAQGVSIMPLRVCSIRASSKARGCPFSAIIEAVNYAGAKGARVANISLGGAIPNDPLADAIAANPQTLFVFGAGNEGVSNEVQPEYPCVYDPLAEGKGAIDNVICVAATDQADELAWFSNWGANTVDLGAPGTQILSTAQYRYFIKDDFEVDDFDLKWIGSGPDGGLVRTDEAPLTSFGISDSPGAPPDPGSNRASRSVPVTVPPGYRGCEVEYTRRVVGGGLWFEYIIDGGEEENGNSDAGTGRRTYKLLGALDGGGEVELSFAYDAPAAPQSGDGLWIDDVQLRCIAKVGEAGGYRFANGTSMAAPHVTGAAALLFSLKPSASVTEVKKGLLGSVDPVSSLAGKTTSGGRLDAAAALDLFDAVPPPPPTLSATDPSSPSKDNQPRLIGSAQRGTTIEVYAGADCSGDPVASGSAAQLAGAGVAVTVEDESVTEFSTKATDLAPLDSDCSAPISYTEDTDLLPPPPPQLTGTDPASSNESGTPRILGTAEAGSNVNVHAGPDCTGPPVATGSAAELGSPGIPVEVAEDATAVFSATATDASENTSGCSAPISYTRVKEPTDPGGGTADSGGGGGASTPIPAANPTGACVVPRLVGRTLPRARAALRAAGCRLGRVRRPRLRNGKGLPPLVVRSSTPAAGTRLLRGKVHLRLGPKPKGARRQHRRPRHD